MPVSQEHLLNVWDTLRHRGITKTTMNVTHRWGMISQLYRNSQGSGFQYRCLACYENFENLLPDTREHKCPYEDDFRQYTGRMIGMKGVSLTRRKNQKTDTPIPSMEVVPVGSASENAIFAEKFILWNAALIAERNQVREECLSLKKEIKKLREELEESKNAFNRLNQQTHTAYVAKLNREQVTLHK